MDLRCVHGLSRFRRISWFWGAFACSIGLYTRRRRNEDRHPVRFLFSIHFQHTTTGLTNFLSFCRNMTWNGLQGFQTPIEDETFQLKDFGVFGNTHTERGLTCMSASISSPMFLPDKVFVANRLLWLSVLDVEFYYSGHMTPRMSRHDVNSWFNLLSSM